MEPRRKKRIVGSTCIPVEVPLVSFGDLLRYSKSALSDSESFGLNGCNPWESCGQKLQSMLFPGGRKWAEPSDLCGKSVTSILGEMAGHFSSRSSNASNKSAATNNDSARVPDSDAHSFSSASSVCSSNSDSLASERNHYMSGRTSFVIVEVPAGFPINRPV